MSTYVPIQAITLSASTSSVDFTNIPQTFTDLIIVASARYVSTNTGQGLGIRFNGDTTSNYSFTILEGNGSTATSYRVANTSSGAMGAIANGSQTSFSVVSTSIQNYTNNTTNKTYIARQSGPSFVQGIVGLWRKTPEPITSISIFGSGTAGNIDAGSTFTLYGIGTGAPKAFGGTTIRTDGTYWYHTFQSSGLFIPLENLTNVDYLVVAGGGAGGNEYSGGGGAGGFRTSAGTSGANSTAEAKLSLSSSSIYPVIVGAGGAPATITLNYNGKPGSSSSFTSIVALGGGGGGGDTDSSGDFGGPGGSGGGGGLDGGSGPGTANQGFAGGAGNRFLGVSGLAGGGGGGASAAGANSTSSTGGAGGNGIASSITGTSATYAGGGGGAFATFQSGTAGAGGTGGGGRGGDSSTSGIPVSGSPNTGGGGGARTNNTSGGAGSGAGGSGIVVIRYAV